MYRARHLLKTVVVVQTTTTNLEETDVFHMGGKKSYTRRMTTTFNLRAATSPVQVVTYIGRKQQFFSTEFAFPNTLPKLKSRGHIPGYERSDSCICKILTSTRSSGCLSLSLAFY